MDLVRAMCIMLIVLVAVTSRTTAVAPEQEKTDTHWRLNAQQYIRAKLRSSSHPNVQRARNVILLLGDGMSLQTIAAARMYIGGEELSLSFERFPHFGLAKTYGVDRQVSDSANTATAYLHGVKSTYGTIGVNAHVRLGSCAGHSNRAYHTESIAAWAQAQCMATGLVTTARVTHASPAGVYAHTANRDWENDGDVAAAGCDTASTADIARQLIEDPVGQRLRVVLGCGRREFRDQSFVDEEGIAGRRTDGRDLIGEWLQQHKDLTAGTNASFVWKRHQLQTIVADRTDFVLGLFGASHCPYHGDIERDGRTDDVPTLSEMTLAAIRQLEHQSEGYFLFVESARIDHAHHETLARKALEEMAEFDRVIELVRQYTNETDTLLVVTSDHSHVMSYNGYSRRGSDILGLSDTLASDGLAFSTLSYANGPGFHTVYTATGTRRNLNTAEFNGTDAEMVYAAMAPTEEETHGGDDVGVYASGPWSHLFVGNYEQNNIPMAMAYAAGIGRFAGSHQPHCSSWAASRFDWITCWLVSSVCTSMALLLS